MNLADLVHVVASLSDHSAVRRLSQVLIDWHLDKRTLIYILIALCIGIVVGRYRSSQPSRSSHPRHWPRWVRTRSFQNGGEAYLSEVLKGGFPPPDYHLMNHVTLRTHDGTTQVDHILVSKFGVFVIETKDYKGWIFANANHAEWTQVLFYRKFRFQNPIHQNFRHVRAVQSLLDFLPSDHIKSAVVFTGEAAFKTKMPPGVFTVAEFAEYLRGETVEVMTANRVQFCVGRIEMARLAITQMTDVQHIEDLARRFGGAD